MRRRREDNIENKIVAPPKQILNIYMVLYPYWNTWGIPIKSNYHYTIDFFKDKMV